MNISKFIFRYSIILLFLFSFSAQLHAKPHSSNLYKTLEIKVKTNSIVNNPFDLLAINLKAQFISPTGEKYTSYGFYDGKINGQMLWIIRFSPNRPGLWKYTLTSNKDYFKLKGGTFLVSSKPENKLIHGPIRVDSNNKRALVHADGIPHYWIGGKWISARDYGPNKKSNETNNGLDPSGVEYGSKSNVKLIRYLELLKKYKHNGILIKTAFYPLEKDNISWDLEWIHRAEWLVQECLKRGINVQMNIFDTWARDKNKLFQNNTLGSMQPFNVWADENDHLKENYIKNIVSRFASYSNIYWELGNEMEHRPNNGSIFAKIANEKYIPWIRKYDPYNLPIGLSEKIWKKTNVDVGFLHQTTDSPDPEIVKPVIMNELVRYKLKPTLTQKIKRKIFGQQWHHGLWHDSAINNPELRFAYRKTFWSIFSKGGTGSSEATWLNINKPFSTALINVMRDHMFLSETIDKYIHYINKTSFIPNFIHNSKVKNFTRGLTRKLYFTYFEGGNRLKVHENQIDLNLSEGKYKVTWLNPKTGKTTIPMIIDTYKNKLAKIRQPNFYEDIVLIVESQEQSIKTNVNQ